MDMSIIKTKICFFRDNHNPKEYFIRVYSEEEAQHKTNCFNHRNGMEKSGYPHIECELALALDIPDNVNCNKEELVHFIIKQFGKKTRESTFLGEWGWFEFSEVTDTDKWLNAFSAYRIQSQQESIAANNSGRQTALF